MSVLDVWLVMLSLLYGFSVLLEVPAVLGVAVHLGKPQAKVRTLAFTFLGARRPLPSGRGRNGPLPVPVLLACARMAPEHLANSIVFGRSVVNRSHG